MKRRGVYQTLFCLAAFLDFLCVTIQHVDILILVVKSRILSTECSRVSKQEKRRINNFERPSLPWLSDGVADVGVRVSW